MRIPSLIAIATVVISPPVAAQVMQSQPANIVTSSGRSYALQAGDILRIDVWGRAEYSGQFQVNDEGVVYYPAIGEFDLNGRTVGDFRDSLLVGLEQLFARPFVTVTPLFRVSITGHVLRPGLYTVDPTLTVFDVIALAGGPTDDANRGKVTLFRDAGATMLDYGAQDLRGRSLSEMGVKSGDDIIVPRKFFTRNDWFVLLQAANVALSIAIFARTF